MINSLSLYPFYRETWGYFDPIAVAQLSPLAYDDCYSTKYYKAPDDDQEVLPVGGYFEYIMEVTPGSLLTHILHRPATGSFDVPGFVFKVTSLDLGIEMFSDPVSDTFVCNNGPGFMPWLLNSAMPSVGNGLFKVEFWNNSGGPLRCNMVFGAQEVVMCKY